MKILELVTENVKRIKTARITPDGNVVKITGKNAQGKTSVLDSIFYALAGKRDIPENVIREGEEKGRVEIEVDDYIIERRFTENDSYLKVTNKDGAEFTSPQSMLDDLTESIAFDPLEFSRKSDKEQVEQLKELTGLDLSELKDEYKEKYQKRRDVGRDKKQLEGELEGYDQTEKVEKVNVGELSEEINEQKKYRNERNIAEDHIEAREQEIKELEKKLKEKKEMLKQHREKREEYEDKFDKEKLEELQEKMSKADEQNEKANEYEKYKEAKEKLEAKADKYSELSDELDEIQKEKEERIEQADMPIDGLNINNGKVTWDGVQFSELSSAEKLRVSMAMAMAMNPDLKVILARDASLLDEDHLEIVEGMAEDKDFQVWLEIVDSSGDMGIYIEEGEVK